MKWEIVIGLMIFLMVFLIVGCESETMQTEAQEDDYPNEISIIKPIKIEEKKPTTGEDIQSLFDPERKLIPRQEQYYQGDLVISNGTYIVNNSNFTLKGNLILNGTGTLVVENSELIFDQEFSQQYRVYVRDNSVMIMDKVKLNTKGKWFNFQYEDSPVVTFHNVHGEDCCIPWHGSGDNTQFSISDSTVGLTLSQNVKVRADNSSLFFELVLTNVNGTYELPAEFRNRYDLIIPNEQNIMELHVTNSTFTDWGATLDKYSNITFVNSRMTLGLNAGSDWEKPAPLVKMRDLKTQTYKDFTLVFDTNRVRLLNTYVRDWYPQAFNKATLEIEDSDLADLQFSSGEATVIVRNSISSLAIARQNVTYKIYNSKITGDVVAHDDAEIYLYDAYVEGIIREVGDGKVFIDGKRMEQVGQ